MVNSLVTLSSVRAQAQGMIGQLVATLLKEGYQQDIAYRIALNQVEEWATTERTTSARTMVSHYHVTPHPHGWVIRQPNSANPCLVFNSQEEATQFGQALAKAKNTTLIIHHDNGDIHSRIAYQ